MSKILLVEPYAMLQHALIVALFPEHQVQIVEDLGTAEAAAEGADLVIIDGVALRQRDAAAPGEIRALQTRPVPIIWIDSGTTADEASAKTVRLAPPFTKEELKTAVADLLPGAAPAVETIHGQANSAAPRNAKAAAKTGPTKVADGKKIIELVDVVDEAAERGGGGGAASRTD
jgi:hypothetical protein